MSSSILLGVVLAATPFVDDAIIVSPSDIRTPSLSQGAQSRLALELPGLGPVECVLERHRITSSSTRFVIGTKGGADRPLAFDPESVRILRGSLAGRPGSQVSLATVGEHLRGTIMLADGSTHRLRAGIDVPVARAEARRPELPLCGCQGSHDHGHGHEPVRDFGVVAPPPRRYRLQLAIETDWEYRQLFDDMDAAAAYIVFAFGLVDEIFQRDVGAGIELTYVRLWDSEDDLFNDPNPLGPFRTYWNENMGDVERNLAQFFSGRRDFPYGGAAYISAICRNAGYSTIGYVLGYSGDIDVPGVDTYDVHVAAHEIGHNCGTYHTHDYGLDDCNELEAAPLRGPIMSYCSQTTSGGQAVTDVRFHDYTRNVMKNYFITANEDYPDCFVLDCNANFISDAEDIVSGLSLDANLDGVPDECQDCNGNGVLDPWDVLSGSSQDIDGNGQPDECEADCNGNGLPDAYDITSGTSLDLWGNGVPDECDVDCDADGVADYNQIQADMTLDLDRDLILDACQDCDGDGTTDLESLDGAWSAWVGSFDHDGEVGQFHSIVGTRTGAVDDGHLAGAWEVVITEDRRILTTSTGDNRVVEFDEYGTYVRDLVTSDQGLASPTGMVVTPSGTLLVSSTADNRVLEFDVQTGALLGEFASGEPWDFIPLNMLVTHDGHLLVASATGTVFSWHLESGESHGAFIDKSNNGGLASPRGMAQIRGGDIIVASMGTNQILRYDGNRGDYVGVFNNGGTDIALTLDEPWGVRVGPDGNVYVSRNGAVHHDDHDDGHDDGDDHDDDDHDDGDDIFDEDDEDIQRLHINSTRLYIFDGLTGGFLRSYVTGHDTELWEPTGFDFMPGPATDCNRNARPDDCDISSGVSTDFNGDGVPDECQCPRDLDGNGIVGVSDLLLVLGDWGPCVLCPTDLDGDGAVDVTDLLLIIGSWGSCF